MNKLVLTVEKEDGSIRKDLYNKEGFLDLKFLDYISKYKSLPSEASEGDRLDIEVHGIELSVVYVWDGAAWQTELAPAYLEALEVMLPDVYRN